MRWSSHGHTTLISRRARALVTKDTNTVIAGLIAEQLTGTSLPDLLAERIFVPELLHSTSFPVGDPAMPDPYMRGYTPPVDGKPMADATESIPMWVGRLGR